MLVGGKPAGATVAPGLNVYWLRAPTTSCGRSQPHKDRSAIRLPMALRSGLAGEVSYRCVALAGSKAFTRELDQFLDRGRKVAHPRSESCRASPVGECDPRQNVGRSRRLKYPIQRLSKVLVDVGWECGRRYFTQEV